MPCYRCGARQVDPEAGKPSPWKRGVLGEHQVLICPACQPAASGDLDRCPRCDSAHLIRRLDQIECLDCALTRGVDASGALADALVPARSPAPVTTDASGAGAAPAGPDSTLAGEVARALDRVLGRRIS